MKRGAKEVWKRDGGVCADCGCDTIRASRVWMYAVREHLGEPPGRPRWGFTYDDRDRERLIRTAGGRLLLDAAVAMGLSKAKPRAKHLRDRYEKRARLPFDVDHVVPVVEGGGLCGPEGLATLCRPCHDVRTRELSGRLAAARSGR